MPIFRRRTNTAERDVEHEFEVEAIPHLDDLFRTALRLTASRTDAEDVMQDVYLQAWRSFDRYERGTNCRAWLFAILHNLLRHYRRGRSTAHRLAIADAGSVRLDSVAGEAFTPDSLSDTEVLEAVDHLPEEFREVVLLADVQDFTYKEVAEILEIPIGTVMSRLSRARRILRMRLADYAKACGVKNPRANECPDE